jgi:outer membrane murein-binding lipoprotein Lpp
MKWGFTLKKRIKFYLIISLSLLSGCSKEAGMDKKYIEETASNVASEYMLVEEDIEFMVTDVQITNDDVGVAFVNGYDKDKKEKEYSVMIDYLADFDVGGYGESE